MAFGRLVRLSAGEVTLAFPKESAFHRATVTGSGRAAVEQALAEHFGRPTRLVEATAETQAPLSIAELEAKGREAREKDVEGKIRSHPAVLATLKRLGGEIEFVRVHEEQPAAPEPEPSEDGH